MKNFDISLIITVKNEAESIIRLLDSIKSQTRKPDEVIIVDGGSTDNTINYIRKYQNNLPLHLIQEEVNISRGRNIAIENAKNPVIVVTDGGCFLEKNYILEIVKPLRNEDIDIVAGKYVGTGDLRFQKMASKLLVYNFDKININNFSPSSRSIAFKKSAWREVNGYPEWLDIAEDTYFNRELRKHKKNFSLNKKAIVYWEMRNSYSSLFNQYYNYAFYDVQGRTNLKLHFIKFLFWMIFLNSLIYSVFLSFVLFIGVLIFGLLMISFMIIKKVGIKYLNIKNYFISLAIFFTVELAQLIGFIYGLFITIKKKLLR